MKTISIKIAAASSCLLLLGTVGGLERNTMPLLPGLPLMAALLAAFGVAIQKINQREGAIMQTKKEAPSTAATGIGAEINKNRNKHTISEQEMQERMFRLVKGVSAGNYGMTGRELSTLYNASQSGICRALNCAFLTGFVRGQRKAKAEQRKKAKKKEVDKLAI